MAGCSDWLTKMIRLNWSKGLFEHWRKSKRILLNLDLTAKLCYSQMDWSKYPSFHPTIGCQHFDAVGLKTEVCFCIGGKILHWRKMFLNTWDFLPEIRYYFWTVFVFSLSDHIFIVHVFTTDKCNADGSENGESSIKFPSMIEQKYKEKVRVDSPRMRPDTTLPEVGFGIHYTSTTTRTSLPPTATSSMWYS